ncbi:DUF6090 family protein [Winogradskyella sp. PE311]|uniref:DUF6090 family protein n=1 Tax=Winogradskyella sp. PE311 TaxID=3366943 RepID=UPI0039806747
MRKNLLFSKKTSSYLIYAIGEIILVMIGILLALYINNWNENRRQDKKLNTILETVRNDLVTDTLVATRIIKFYDSINKYSTKVINYEYDKANIEDCILCRSLITLYQPFTVQDKGYSMLLTFEELDNIKPDSLQVSIIQFYKSMTTILDQSNDFVKSETLKNLQHYRTKDWFIDWMQGRFTKEMKVYFGSSIDYKNRVASNLILASTNHGSFIKTHKAGAVELITRIDKRFNKKEN